LLKKATTSLSSPFNSKTFYFDNGSSNLNLNNVTMRNILAYEYVGAADSHSHKSRAVAAGYDNITGVWKKVDLKATDVIPDMSLGGDRTTGGGTFDATFLNNHSGSVGEVSFQITPSGQYTEQNSLYDPFRVLDKVAKEKIFVSQATQSSMVIEVYGDTDITVGDGIKVKLPPGSGIGSDENKTASLISGNYLVTAIRHMIINSGRSQHKMVVGLVRGTYSNGE